MCEWFRLFNCRVDLPHFAYSSSVRGHLGRFYFGAIINTAVMATYVCGLLYEHMSSVLSGVYLRVEFLGHTVILCLTF